jgi:protein phosphatase
LVERLQPALEKANGAIATAIARDPTMKGAGCTLLAASIEGDAVSWVSVGDSLLLLLRDGKLERLNEDHSMRSVFSRMVAEGQMTAAEAERNPRRHSLRSALTGNTIPLVNASPKPVRLALGDQLIAASDGLETLGTKDITVCLMRSATPSAIVDRLLKAAMRAGTPHQDNTTIICYRAGANRRVASER